MDDKLGVLKNVSLREIWTHEALDFTPWLAKEENLAKLSEVIGLELQLERTEVPVGAYSADVLARDASGNYVVIENQFNRTNHDHLGKLLTYGATLGAAVLVWIAEEFTEEHRKAIQWLNDRTTEELSVYAVKPEVLQIDNSKPAIRFTVVGQPNEIVRAAAVAKSTGNLSEGQRTQLEFWTSFRDRLLERKVVISPQTPRPGAQMLWNPNPDASDKVIALYRDIKLDDRASWPRHIDWLVDMNEKFLAAFKPRVRGLNLNLEVAFEAQGVPPTT
ncbi:hypothetical protein [Bradyrhizobium sp. USDA 4353]